MIKFGDLTELIGSPGAVIFSFWASSVGAVTLNKFYPDFFIGLPTWVIPTLWLVVIFSTAGLGTILFKPATRMLAQSLSYLSRPYRKRRLRKRLLSLSLDEVFCLSIGLAERKTEVRLPPNTGPVYSLLDKGLIVKSSSIVFFSGPNEEFNIPEFVWRTLIEMPEFAMQEPQKFTAFINGNRPINSSMALKFLPAQHPAVIYRLSVKKDI